MERAAYRKEEYLIRVARKSDLDELMTLRGNEELWNKYFAQCDGKNGVFHVAEIDSKVVGFGLIFLRDYKTLLPKLSDLFVRTEYRHRGIGGALIRERERIAREEGFRQLFVSVDPIENPKMVQTVIKNQFAPLREKPYRKTALYYTRDGTPYWKSSWRMDYRKELI